MLDLLGYSKGGLDMQINSTDWRSWSPLRILIKCLALAVPWGIIEVALARYQHPDAGYAIGILVGLLCMYAVPPRDTALWRFLLIGIVMIIVQPILRLFLPR
jgi:hypothetical protein